MNYLKKKEGMYMRTFKACSESLAVGLASFGFIIYFVSCGMNPELAQYDGQSNGDLNAIANALANSTHTCGALNQRIEAAAQVLNSGYNGYSGYAGYAPSYAGYSGYGYEGYAPSYAGYSGFTGYSGFAGYTGYHGYANPISPLQLRENMLQKNHNMNCGLESKIEAAFMNASPYSS